MENINIPAPKFHLYEFVTLYWNEKTYSTRIVARWYDLDRQNWWYKVANNEQFYSADVLERRSTATDLENS